MPKPNGPAIPGKPPPLTMSGKAYADLCALHEFLEWLAPLVSIVQDPTLCGMKEYWAAEEGDILIPEVLQVRFGEGAKELATARRIVLTHARHFPRPTASGAVRHGLTELEAEIADGQCKIDESKVARWVAKVWAAVLDAQSSQPVGGSQAATERVGSAKSNEQGGAGNTEKPVETPDAQAVPTSRATITMRAAAEAVGKTKDHFAKVYRASDGPSPIVEGGGRKGPPFCP